MADDMESSGCFLTKVSHFPRLSRILKIRLLVKRDDLFPELGGGNKARKLHRIVAAAKREGYNSVVTAGGAQSNHVRATALMAVSLGWKATMIVHARKPRGKLYSGNLKITGLTGVNLRFVKMEDVAAAMDEAMAEFDTEGLKPLYIWGGGHCPEGAYAYYDAVRELKWQLKNECLPDYVVVASGTGTTQAGIEVGCREYLPTCEVLGVSVSRERERGERIVLESIKQLNEYLGRKDGHIGEVHFDDRWRGRGYESAYAGLVETIQWAARTEGLILDPTYTGKAFHALLQYINAGRIKPESTVVFWHTGGLLNLLSTPFL